MSQQVTSTKQPKAATVAPRRIGKLHWPTLSISYRNFTPGLARSSKSRWRRMLCLSLASSGAENGLSFLEKRGEERSVYSGQACWHRNSQLLYWYAWQSWCRGRAVQVLYKQHLFSNSRMESRNS